MKYDVSEAILVLRRYLGKTGAKRRGAARGVTLVEVLIVVSIMAVIAGGATLLAFPMFNEAKIKSAVVGCATVKSAAELYQNMEGSSDQCPTMQDLVASKKLAKDKTDDPWNTPYKIQCDSGEIKVLSAGKDRKEGTPDDIRDDFKDADVKRVKAL